MLEYIKEYLDQLWFLLLEMAPWLLLGLIFAGLLKVYFPQKHIDKYLGKSNFRSSLNAALLGIPMPLCSCGVIPTGISFYKNGASKGATNSFLISTPQTGVDSIFATYSMLGWPFALLRPIVAFFTGVLGGVLTNLFDKEKPKPKVDSPFSGFKIDTVALGKSEETCDDDSCDCSSPKIEDKRFSLIKAADYAFIELLQDIAKWLVFGFLVAALISVILPDDFFSSFQGLGLIELLVILAASIPIYICATGSIPIAAVLLMKGVSPGAALVFLMAGPATNVATMTVLGKTMGRKSLIIYLLTITVGALVFGMLTNLLIPEELILSKIVHLHNGEEHQMLPEWLQIFSAFILVFSIVGGYFFQKSIKKNRMEKLDGITVNVAGMTCSHCETNVKKNLESLKGITNVVADNSSNSVKITGTKINLEKVKEIINGLGYTFVD